ncbi:MAG: FeoB-associated Cys-rich membrane protein [Desulfoplanes sp.]|nr:FeoB-associated Cys-rich membrane protein [Desulfoplanes sp.]MDD4649869.1 FeoB-associated Cys-rich membrane protein [Desulfoplanes sp.]
MSWDTIFVYAIIGVAAVYIISRFIRKKGLGCSSCPGNCSGKDSSDACKVCPMAPHVVKKKDDVPK